ncbi:MAG: PAS domain S-box protein [Bacteroidetes bacterium]|nr:PAS domain S-box protein [Bacteroidota bacterium]
MSFIEYRILILEGLGADASLVEMQIRKAGFPFIARGVGSKEMFLTSLADFQPDLVIASNSVQRMDVLATLNQTKKDIPDLPWIVIPASANEELAVSFMKAGASDYVNKKNITRVGAIAKKVLQQSREALAGKKPEPLPVEEQPKPEPRPVEPSAPESELAHLLQLLVESIDDLVAIVNLDGKRIYNNPAYARVLEDPEILEGTDSFLDVHPDDRETVKRVFHDSLRRGVGRRIEYRLLDLDGNFRHMESQGTVFHDDRANVKRLAVISRDMTIHKRAESSFQNLVAGTASVTGDEFFTALVRHLAHALGVRYVLVSEIVTPEHDKVRALAYWANEQWVPSFEYDVTNTTCARVLQEGKLCYYPEHVQELFPKESALVAMHAVCYMGIPLFNSAGDLIGHMFIMDDKPLEDFQRTQHVMSIFAARAAMELERKRVVDGLKRAEANWRSALQSLNDGVIITDMGDIITYVNPRMAQLSGYAESEMVGRLASTLLLPKEEWERLQLRNRERRKGFSERYDTKLKRKDGTWFRAVLSAGPYRDAHGDIVGTLAVVTEPVADGG